MRARLAAPEMASLRQDLVFGMRQCRKNPGITFAAVIALAIGIGANATVFTIANGFLFRNLPFADSGRILYISSVNRAGQPGGGESWPDYRDFQAQAKSFQALGAFSRFDADVADAARLPMQYKGARITTNAFSAIGQTPILGRDFLPEDAAADAPPVVILAYELWISRYGGERSILGRTIRVNESPTIVIGVMRPDFHFPVNSNLWVPLKPTADWTRREYRALTMFGRPAGHVTPSMARAEMTTIAHGLESQYPVTNKDIGVRVESFNDYFIGKDTRLILLALLGAVGFVLLIACGNVVSLLLGRAVVRSREVCIRAALGAGRWRIVRQLLLESLILAAAGGLLGSVLGIWGVRIFDRQIIPDERASYMNFTMDYRVLAYLVAITIGAGILAGLVPALKLSRLEVAESMKDGGHTSIGRKGRKLQASLIALEMALCFVLLVGAGLMIRSFLNMARTPIGAETDHLMSMDILLRPARYPTEVSQLSFYSQLLSRVQSLPGVVRVGMASNLPGDGWTDLYYELDGAPPADPRRAPKTGGVIVSPTYFSLLGVRLVRGRFFTDEDGVRGLPAVIVNRAFAEKSWPGQDAMGKRLRIIVRNSAVKITQPWLTVTGIAPDIVQNDESQGLHDPLLYLPYREMPQREMVIAARTAIPPELLANDLRRAVQGLDGDLPVTDLRTLDQLLRERTWRWRVYGGMFSIFACLAFLLASVGLYSVIAHSTHQRIQEIGIRMAVGATRADILRMVIAGGVRQVLIGLAAGLAGSFGLTQMLDEMLVGVSAADPVTLVTVGLGLVMAGGLGAAIPAVRATRVNPAAALRHEWT
ncbi:MAG: ABC transporter permease [Acidobacteriota bacterium]|nr:ABC transporter permease [Acidobacteriota bacterium]